MATLRQSGHLDSGFSLREPRNDRGTGVIPDAGRVSGRRSGIQRAGNGAQGAKSNERPSTERLDSGFSLREPRNDKPYALPLITASTSASTSAVACSCVWPSAINTPP